ncbi:MAG: TonB family protein [Nannocystaceae bacterium]|nr:TonB family protein [Nannocystaceae bacterium]
MVPGIAMAAPPDQAPTDEPDDVGDLQPQVPDAAPDALRKPVLNNAVTLEYPEALASESNPPSGQVVVQYVVGVDGKTKEIEVSESLHPDLDAAAVLAVAALEYEPALYEGEAVELVLTIAIEVTPPPKPEPEPGPESATQPAAEPVDKSPEHDPPGPVRIRGIVLEAGQRQPLSGSIIMVYPAKGAKLGRVPFRKRQPPDTEPAWTSGTETDQAGVFELRDVQEGRVRIVIMTQGFERLEHVVELGNNEQLDLKYYQVRMNTNPYRTEVETDADPIGEVRRHKLKPEELAKLPGSNGDALKALQDFPGVARSPFGIGQLTIRGAAPGDSAVYLGGHELPSLFHFGGITSVFNSSLIEEMSLVPGNFDSRYGNAIGGVVDIQTRKGRRDGYHGYVKADIFDAAIVAEGPIGKGSFTLSGRRSYIDAILAVAIPDDASLNFSVAPRYYDYSAAIDYPIAGGDFTARVLGSDDRLALVFGNDNDEQPDVRGNLDTVIWFHRADLAYRKKWHKWTFFVSPSYRRDFFSLNLGSLFRFDFTTDRFSGRAEVAREVGERSHWRIGTEIVTDWTAVNIKAPPVQGNATGPRGGGGPEGADQLTPLVSKYSLFTARPALYSTFRWGITDRVAVSPGFRLTYIEGLRDGVTFDPRITAEVKATDRTTVTGAVGIYSQSRNTPANDPTFGNPRLKPDQAAHVSLGVSQEFSDGWTASGTGFYKYLWSLAAASPKLIEGPDGQQRPELFDNAGVGRIYGGELMVRKDMTNKLYGWAAYTVSRSEIRQRPGESFSLFDYDQTHILTLLAAYRLPRNWQIGARFRLASGNPFTPDNDAVAQLREGLQIQIAGDYNSSRMRLFHQLDVRVDKAWTFKRVKLSVYLDIQNIYNAKNPELINESWNYQQETTVNSLPIIPSVGLKLDW